MSDSLPLKSVSDGWVQLLARRGGTNQVPRAPTTESYFALDGSTNRGVFSPILATLQDAAEKSRKVRYKVSPEGPADFSEARLSSTKVVREIAAGKDGTMVDDIQP